MFLNENNDKIPRDYLFITSFLPQFPGETSMDSVRAGHYCKCVSFLAAVADNRSVFVILLKICLDYS